MALSSPKFNTENVLVRFCTYSANGRTISHHYVENEETRRSVLNRLTRDEARRIAANIRKAADEWRMTKHGGNACNTPWQPARENLVCNHEGACLADLQCGPERHAA
jgi:hypothetical protein